MDIIDLACDLEIAQRERSIAAVIASIPHPSAVCLDCGEYIGALRFTAGACRCIDCQRDHERERRRYALRS